MCGLQRCCACYAALVPARLLLLHGSLAKHTSSHHRDGRIVCRVPGCAHHIPKAAEHTAQQAQGSLARSCTTPLCPMHADASIWLFQFMRAMRDERGEMMRNAHLLGFFRRICRWALWMARCAAEPTNQTDAGLSSMSCMEQHV